MSDIKLPTKMIKRGRPKGSTENVVGLPRKKLRKGLLPFAKTPIHEKRKVSFQISLIGQVYFRK